MKTPIASLIFFIICGISHAQLSQPDRLVMLRQKLSELAQTSAPGLNEKVEVSVSGATVQEFLRSIAIANHLNISVDPGIDIKVVNTFSGESVLNILLFLCRQYELEIQFAGSILSVSKYISPPLPVPKALPKNIEISYNAAADQLTLDLKCDSLDQVVKKITQLSGKNVLLAPDLLLQLASGYIQNMVFESALDKFAFANALSVTKTRDGAFLLDKKQNEQQAGASSRAGHARSATVFTSPAGDNGAIRLEVKDDSTGVKLISGEVSSVPITDVLREVSRQMDINYFLFSDIKGNTTASIKDMRFENFLQYILQGSDYTFKKEGGIYLIGERNLEGLRMSRLVQLQYRSADTVVALIPSEIKKGIELKTFSELNSVVISGSGGRIGEVEAFIRDIDKLVPVVMIEVMVVDVRKNHTVSTGIKAGISDSSVVSGGSVFPAIDYTLGSKSINNLLSLIEGHGVVNMGRVTPGFYLSLKAMENQGNIRIRSTPKLSTLNGHSARMKIGETRYYLEQTSNIIGSQNPQTVITQQYKQAKADLSIEIRPLVSGDDQVTLEIEVELSNFTGTPAPNAPPGTATRQFKSLIRIKNGEMIVLGGLDEKEISDTGSGVPFLSRIPVLKWFFSSRTRSRSSSKLNIFIKPLIIY